MKNIFFVLFNNYGSKILSLLASLYIRRELGPGFAGDLAVVNLFVFYLDVFYGIFRNALDREVPIAKGRQDYAFAQEIQSLVYWAILLLTIVSSLIFISGAYLYWNEPGLRYAFLLGIALNNIGSIAGYLKISFKVAQNFKAMSLHGITISAVAQIAYVVGVFWGRIPGYAAAGLLSMASIAAFYMIKYGFRPFVGIRLKTCRMILSSGIPLSIYSLVLLGLATVDRMFIIKYFSHVDLGYYTLGLLFSSALVLLPTSLSTAILMPKWFGWVAQKRWEQLHLNMLAATMFSLLTTALVSQFVIWLLPWFIRSVLPNFEGGIKSSQILTLSVYWFYMFQPFSVVLSARGQYSRMIICGAIAVVLSIFTNLLMVKYGIEGIAWATLVTLVFFSNLIFIVSKYSSGISKQKMLTECVMLNGVGLVSAISFQAGNNWLFLALLPLIAFILFQKPLVLLKNFLESVR